MSISEVVSNNACIGCGNCEIASKGQYKVQFNKYGLLESNIPSNMIASTNMDDICPVESNLDEDYFNSAYKQERLDYNPRVGNYRNVYAAYVNSPSRVLSSSGGIATHIIKTLFAEGLIDGAIVVNMAGTYSQYSVIRSVDELESSRKSKYHVTSHADAVSEVLESKGRYVYVGIPCGVKAIKLLCEKDEVLKASIKYTVAVFCGHQKSHAFSEFVAWQSGIKPEEFKGIDYRVKKKERDASKYYYGLTGAKYKEARVDRLKWMDWGLGLFKPLACDFCDDVSGEAADITVGDAWHKKYSKDYRGTNIVITRTKLMDDLLARSKRDNSISLFEESVDFIFETQGGNFRHGQDGLLSRLEYLRVKAKWIPRKSPQRLGRWTLDEKNHDKYVKRLVVSAESHRAFFSAKNRSDLKYFWKKMNPLIEDLLRMGKTSSQYYADTMKAKLKSLF
jgi:coenzyme F420 hydrogenase subunit beta